MVATKSFLLASTGFSIATAGPAWPACMAACVPSGAGGPGAYSACLIVCGGLTCFEDNTTMVKVAHNCETHAMPSASCLSRFAVQDLMPGDMVLAENMKGSKIVTKVVHNSRHVGLAKSVTIRVNASDTSSLTVTGNHLVMSKRPGESDYYSRRADSIVVGDTSSLTVTGNHLVMSKRPGESDYYLRRADSIVAGDVVPVDGQPGVVAHIEHAEMDHHNHLVTAVGTVLANDVHVSTVCEDYAEDKFAGLTAEFGLAAWREDHMMAAFEQQV